MFYAYINSIRCLIDPEIHKSYGMSMDIPQQSHWIPISAEYFVFVYTDILLFHIQHNDI